MEAAPSAGLGPGATAGAGRRGPPDDPDPARPGRARPGRCPASGAPARAGPLRTPRPGLRPGRAAGRLALVLRPPDVVDPPADADRPGIPGRSPRLGAVRAAHLVRGLLGGDGRGG